MAKPACEEQLPRIEMAGDGFLRRTSFRVQSVTARRRSTSTRTVHVAKRRSFRSMIVVASYSEYNTSLLMKEYV